MCLGMTDDPSHPSSFGSSLATPEVALIHPAVITLSSAAVTFHPSGAPY
jgi:hypothetical protein